MTQAQVFSCEFCEILKMAASQTGKAACVVSQCLTDISFLVYYQMFKGYLRRMPERFKIFDHVWIFFNSRVSVV